MEFKGRTIWNGQVKPAEVSIISEHAHSAKSSCLQHVIVIDDTHYASPAATLDDTRALLESHGYRLVNATWDTNGKKQYMSKGNALPRSKTWRYAMSALTLPADVPFPARDVTWERVAVSELRPGDVIVERLTCRTVRFPLRNFSKWQIIFTDRSVLYAAPDAVFVVERPANAPARRQPHAAPLLPCVDEDEPGLVRRDVDDYVNAGRRERASAWHYDNR